MRKLNIITGIPICLLIAGLVNLPHIFRGDNLATYLQFTGGYFVFSMFMWVLNHLIINSAFFRSSGWGKLSYFLIALVSGCTFSFVFDHTHIIDLSPIISVPISATSKTLALVCRGMMFNVLNAFLVLHIHSVKEKEQQKLELEQLKQAQLQANMSTLKEQLSPHFLFNTFNTLTTLTTEQPVIDYVEQLSNVYRYVLSHQKHDWVKLREELGFTESYLYIIKTRLESAIDVQIDVRDEVLDSRIPPLTLQLLVENAIKHNITASTKPLKITIYDDEDKLIIMNNHQPKQSVSHSSGIGLSNIEQRYNLLFNRSIHIKKLQDDLFMVILPLLP